MSDRAHVSSELIAKTEVAEAAGFSHDPHAASLGDLEEDN